jgi:hypothetical protein
MLEKYGHVRDSEAQRALTVTVKAVASAITQSPQTPPLTALGGD